MYKVVHDILEALGDISRSEAENTSIFTRVLRERNCFYRFYLVLLNWRSHLDWKEYATECYEYPRLRPLITKDIAYPFLQSLRDVPKERPKVDFPQLVINQLINEKIIYRV